VDLLIGSYVREHGKRIGRLAGFELTSDRAPRVSGILVRSRGRLGRRTLRDITAVALIHDDGGVELALSSDDPRPPRAGAVLWTPATQLTHGDQAIGRLAGVEVDASEWKVLSVLTRPHWWSRRVSFSAERLALTASSEIRVATGTRFRAA
jgi:hypothetical protein